MFLRLIYYDIVINTGFFRYRVTCRSKMDCFTRVRSDGFSGRGTAARTTLSLRTAAASPGNDVFSDWGAGRGDDGG